MPSPMPVLLLLVGAATAVWITTESPMSGLGLLGAVLLPAAIYWFSRRLEFATIGLIAAAAIPRFSVDISGLNAKPEHLMAGMVLVLILFQWKRLPQKPKWTLPDYLVAAYLLLNILSSWFMSPDPAQTVKWSLQQAVAILPYFLLRAIISDAEKFRRSVRVLLVVGAVVASLGVICYFSHFFFNTSFGVEVNQYGDIPAAYGTLYEANLLGSFCGAVFIITLVAYSQKPSRSLLFGLFVTATAVAVSLSRAALGATAIASFVFVFVGRRLGLLRKEMMKKAVLSLSVLGVVLALTLLPYYVQRFSSFTPEGIANDSEAQSRVIGIVLAMENFVAHPILGNGTSSMQLFYTYGEAGVGAMDRGFWIANFEMRILHDTGIVGFIVFAAFLWIILVRSLRALKQQFNPELLALFLSALVYCITFQTTEGTLLAFPWVHLGLIACALSTGSSSGYAAVCGTESRSLLS